jgi:hypothetical protein
MYVNSPKNVGLVNTIYTSSVNRTSLNIEHLVQKVTYLPKPVFERAPFRRILSLEYEVTWGDSFKRTDSLRKETRVRELCSLNQTAKGTPPWLLNVPPMHNASFHSAADRSSYFHGKYPFDQSANMKTQDGGKKGRIRLKQIP